MLSFHDFVKQHVGRRDELGDAARACLHALLVERLTPYRCLDELREEALCEGAHHGIKKLWALWAADHPEAEERAARSG